MAENVLGVNQGGTGATTDWSPKAAAKTADETVTSSATVQDDDHLSFAGVAGATYQFALNIKSVANASGGLKWLFALPSSSSGRAGVSGFGAGADADVDITTGNGVTAAIAATAALTINGYITFGTAGTARFKWAQNASFGTGTTIKRGSNLTAIRVS